MLSVAQAREAILNLVQPLPPARVAISDALDHVLAENVVAPLNLPSFDNSAVDGYAVRAADVTAASENNRLHLRVIGEIAAGKSPDVKVVAGTAARIFTGAPIPEGADAIVMQEDTEERGDGFVAVLTSVSEGENIRRAGEDVREGDTVFHAGTTLGPAQICMLAALGRAEIRAIPRPKAGVLVTGAELISPGKRLEHGQIYDSNSFALLGWLKKCGCDAQNFGIADDTSADLETKIEAALENCDVLITVGGVSVGEYDLVKQVLTDLGCQQQFWKVSMRPGKPLAVATRGRKIVFGLPGNPVSATMTFLVLVRPALLKMRGLSHLELPHVRAEAAQDFVNRSTRTHFMRAKLTRLGDKWLAAPLPHQGSHVITSIAHADCFVEVEAETTLRAGSQVTAWLLSDAV